MKFRVTLTVALATLALTSCGSSSQSGTPTGSAAGTSSAPTSTKASKDELVAWVDKVCGVTIQSIAPMEQEPALDTKNLTTMKTQFVDYLQKASDSLGKGVTDLEPFKQGPSKDSEKYVTSHTETLTKLKTTLDSSIEKVKASDPKNPQKFATDIQLVGTEISSAGLVASSSIGVLVEKDLADAEKQAANCQKRK
ncbi:hypothetical protein JOF56_007747 [Kibdelosporangium banguiense]|uniref:Small secreted protein n=1 Tax=Kibdelosporangium banguiense TaxID=1365924 RepID=A0ABS4TSH1_9PSEU|nr:hypothetical protein [Kibdelosporangium banguiense]MBP2327362.1 hypothetical protein [Kibdelosporangium banguiense]